MLGEMMGVTAEDASGEDARNGRWDCVEDWGCFDEGGDRVVDFLAGCYVTRFYTISLGTRANGGFLLFLV